MKSKEWLVLTDAQADLSLCCLYMAYSTFSFLFLERRLHLRRALSSSAAGRKLPNLFPCEKMVEKLGSVPSPLNHSRIIRLVNFFLTVFSTLDRRGNRDNLGIILP